MLVAEEELADESVLFVGAKDFRVSRGKCVSASHLRPEAMYLYMFCFSISFSLDLAVDLMHSCLIPEHHQQQPGTE